MRIRPIHITGFLSAVLIISTLQAPADPLEEDPFAPGFFNKPPVEPHRFVDGPVEIDYLMTDKGILRFLKVRHQEQTLFIYRKSQEDTRHYFDPRSKLAVNFQHSDSDKLVYLGLTGMQVPFEAFYEWSADEKSFKKVDR